MKTRCPHCQTLFKITNEQLKIHSGQVRCGNCKKLFNAFDALNQVEIDSINDEVSVKVTPKNDEKIKLDFAENFDEVIEIKPPKNVSKKEKKQPSKTKNNSKEIIKKVDEAAIKKADDEELKSIEKSLSEIDLLLSKEDEVKTEPELNNSNDDNENNSILNEEIKIDFVDAVDEVETKSEEKNTENNTENIKTETEIKKYIETENNVKTNIKNSVKVNVNNVNNVNISKNIHNEEEKTLPSWFNAAIISVLSLFLVLQIFVHFRNNIVNSFPAFRSVYSALNLSLVSNTKNIEQITIEASDLNNVNIATNAANKSILKLKIMLGNRANFNQNWPLIELNLTDTLDQSVAKYTFTPQDYLDYLIYHNVAKELENNHNNNNENKNDLKAKYQQEELLYKQYKQKLKYFQAHSEQTIELYIETDNINAAGYKLAVGYL